MANDSELVDGHVSLKQCKRAIEALHAHATKLEKKREETELLPGKEQHIWLQITIKTMRPERKLKPFRIPLKHPMVDPRTSRVCLITKDPQREYKDLLERHNIKFISRVVGVEKLKGKFKAYEARRLLLKENALFLADERVVPLLPRLLGTKWFQAKKQPTPVCLTRKNLKGELERAIESSYMHQNRGTCTSVKIGLVSHTPKQLLANLETALPAIVRHIKDGWDNVQSLHIKTSTSISLPIWTCELGSDEGGRWNGLVAEAKKELASDEEEEEKGGEGEGEGEEEDGEEEEDEEPVEPKKADLGIKRRMGDKKAEQPKKRVKGHRSRLPARIHTIMPGPKILSTEPLSNAHSKFIALTRIHYQDQDGKQRVWECAERKTVQGHTGKDAVAILAILSSKTNAFPLSTIILEQYRPPVDKHVIEFPAGLLNAPTAPGEPDEEARTAALRELEEETGYKASLEDVLECTPTIACDPGMTTAKMKLVIVKVELEDKMTHPAPKPDPGEHIVVRVVELAQLKRVLQDYDEKGFIVDTRLSHFASGYDIAERIRNGRL